MTTESASLVKELCDAYRLLIQRDDHLISALGRIRELESRQQSFAQQQQPATTAGQRYGTERDNQQQRISVRMAEVTSNVFNDENALFQVTIRRPATTGNSNQKTRKRPELRVVDSNQPPTVTVMAAPVTPGKTRRNSLPTSHNSRPSPWSNSHRKDKYVEDQPKSSSVEDGRRASAVSILTSHSQVAKDKERPPFIPAGGVQDGTHNTFNIHSIRQVKEKEKVESDIRPYRHRGIVQQPRSHKG